MPDRTEVRADVGKLRRRARIAVGNGDFDQALVAYLQRERSLLIGQETAGAIRSGIGSAYPLAEEERAEIVGRHLIGGFPHRIVVTSEEVRAASAEELGRLADGIASALDEFAGDFAPEIIERVPIEGADGLRGLRERVADVIRAEYTE